MEQKLGRIRAIRYRGCLVSILPKATAIKSILYYTSRYKCLECGAQADVEELQGTSKSIVMFHTCDITCSHQGKCFFVNTMKLKQTRIDELKNLLVKR